MSPGIDRQLLMSLLLGAIILTGCANAATDTPSMPTEASPAGQPVDHGPPIPWNKSVIVNGVPTTASDAAKSLAFTPVVPQSLGEPTKTLMTAPESGPVETRAFALQYQDPNLGLFWIAETVSTTSQQELENTANNCTAAAGCEASLSVQTLSDGKRVLLNEGPGSTYLEMLNSGDRFSVLGPPDTFTRDDALKVAEAVESAATQNG